jgi:hypothetical protein
MPKGRVVQGRDKGGQALGKVMDAHRQTGEQPHTHQLFIFRMVFFHIFHGMHFVRVDRLRHQFKSCPFCSPNLMLAAIW